MRICIFQCKVEDNELSIALGLGGGTNTPRVGPAAWL